MVGSIDALGRNTPVQTVPDVFATDGKSGEAEKTAAAKPSFWVSHGAKNRAAGVVEKATAKAQELDDRLLHRSPELISADDLRYQNGVQEPNV